MNPWPELAILAAAVGTLCGRFVRPDRARLLGAVIPWASVVAYMLYLSRSSGGQLWIVGVLTGGTFAAVVGALAAGIVRSLCARAADRERAARRG